jgi:hypothetical protein
LEINWKNRLQSSQWIGFVGKIETGKPLFFSWENRWFPASIFPRKPIQ